MSGNTDLPQVVLEWRGIVPVNVAMVWGAMRAAIVAIFVTLGAVLWGSGASVQGQLLVLLGLLWYSVSPG